MEREKLVGVLKKLTTKEQEALQSAVESIYVGDSDDYLKGLWEVVIAILDEDITEDGIDIGDVYNIFNTPDE